MNKILLFILSLGFSINIIAQTSNLTVFSENGNPFYLILNGIRQNENAETNVRVDGLINEYYSVKIIFSEEILPVIEKKILMVVDADAKRGEVSYRIKKNKKGDLVLRYYSFTPAKDVTKAPSSVAVVHYNTKPLPAIVFNSNISVTNTTISTSSTNSEDVTIGMNTGNIGANINITEQNTEIHQSTTNVSISSGAEFNYSHEYDEYEIIQDCYPMESGLFSTALKSIKDKDFSDTQLSQAKQITKVNCLNSMQIKEICKLFDFEDTKLEFAKFAYQYCFDQNNYWQINDIFEFSSTVDELNDFLTR